MGDTKRMGNKGATIVVISPANWTVVPASIFVLVVPVLTNWLEIAKTKPAAASRDRYSPVTLGTSGLRLTIQNHNPQVERLEKNFINFYSK
jgi:hypothetical protein